MAHSGAGFLKKTAGSPDESEWEQGVLVKMYAIALKRALQGRRQACYVVRSFGGNQCMGSLKKGNQLYGSSY